MQFRYANIHYDQSKHTFPAGKMTFFEECYLDFKQTEGPHWQRYQITIHPKQDIQLKGLELVFQLSLSPSDSIFCNGYQSWSESREYGLDEHPDQLRPFARKWLKYAGDQQFDAIQKGKGWLHSWTYTYLRRDKELLFWGSLREDTAFTVFQYQLENGELLVRKDIEALQLSHSFPILDLFVSKGSMDTVFSSWTKLMEQDPPLAPKLTGWTSWYQHYTDISAAIIKDNTQAFADHHIPIDLIQIDDGYQTAVGDWLSIKDNFPDGMSVLASDIHRAGFKAGLWLAPFICDSRSDLFKSQPSWLLKDQNSQPVKAGYNPLWGGWFYALDFYNKKVQEYLTGVLYTALKKWNYDLLKLDFLYAVCLHPPPDKTRGQVMHEAMQFLRHVMGDKLMLACGVPLASAFHCADYCRIGADIHLQWEHGLLRFLRHRERVSTRSALRSTIGRWPLNGRVFHNDPDVFILRKENNKLTEHQQYSILLINRLLGNLLLTSDHPAQYSPEARSEMQLLFELKDARVHWIENYGKDRYRIDFIHRETPFSAYCNLNPRTWEIAQMSLEPFESMIRFTGERGH